LQRDFDNKTAKRSSNFLFDKIMTKAGLCGLTIFHRLTTFGFKKLLKSGQTMKNRQTTSRSIVKKVSNRELLKVKFDLVQ
jgi:hypothetical protein